MLQFYHRLENMSRDIQVSYGREQKNKLCNIKSTFINFIRKGDDESLNNENLWAMPTPLRPDGTNHLPFHVNALPPILEDMASAIATTTSTDVAMAGTAILSAVSYCFSGVYRMSAKRDHTEPLVLDALTIAEPSFKK